MNNYDETVKTLINSIGSVASSVDQKKLDGLVDALLKKRKIFIHGSGRSGLVGQYFAVRLVQLGLNVYFIGDMTTPIVGKDDLTIIISNTGETVSCVQTANISRRLGSEVISITSSARNKLAHASNSVIIVNTEGESNGNLLPLGTLFEDATIVMFDSLIPTLMEKLNLSEDDMRRNHAIWV